METPKAARRSTWRSHSAVHAGSRYLIWDARLLSLSPPHQSVVLFAPALLLVGEPRHHANVSVRKLVCHGPLGISDVVGLSLAAG